MGREKRSCFDIGRTICNVHMYNSALKTADETCKIYLCKREVISWKRKLDKESGN